MTRIIHRREFLRETAVLGLGLTAFPALKVLAEFESSLPNTHEVDRRWYRTFDGTHTQCAVCPLNCVLESGQTCFCRTRRNHDGKLLSHAYENPCVISIDPIEKLPLHHCLPSQNTLSLAVGGCNLRCLYCQNWRQSQAMPQTLKNFELRASDVPAKASSKQCQIIAYTYTEPVAFFEYMTDIAALAARNRVRNVCASAMFINPDPLRELCKQIDAFAVALKGFDEKFYDRVLGSRLAPVLKAIETLRAEKKWFEIVTLIIPTYNDDLDKIREMCRWIARTVGPDTPIHFGRFVPEHKLKDLPRTPVPTLERCHQIACEEGLRYVYIFNVAPHEANNTYCHACRKTVIKRLGFKVLENHLSEGRCGFCRTAIPGVWV
ncbi:MAG: AmmeMemoRadiSam system radical SAM enzyme [Verrucomicrobia bacterium]|nr:AmmeMemoRadiSam system radical SAM enzyme [Verrucomicrobiota bacterium]